LHGRRAWRLAGYLGQRPLDLCLRLRGARDLPRGYRARLAILGLPWDAIEPTLRSVHCLADWPVAWTATAQRFLGETRRPDAESPAGEADELVLARARLRAAACYHVAHWLAYEDPRAVRAMRSAAVALFTRAAPLLYPDLTPVKLYWRGKALDGYLRLPASDGPAPLVALLNGVTTSKEELIRWADAFLARGQAVLALDQPGTGEATDLGRPSVDHDDLSDAILDFVATRPELDERRVALLGVSVGGAQAVLGAALDRRLAAAVAVTPPFEPAAWLAYVNSVVRDQVAGFAGGETALPFLAEEFSLAGLVARLQTPLLVIGAGRDLVVPPAEAIRLAAAAGEWATLLWYANAGHVLYEMMPWWTADAAAWLDAVLASTPGDAASTQVDAATRARPAPATSPSAAARPAAVAAEAASAGPPGAASDRPIGEGR
jgi:alpha-beta hydrolase superfamily lysophospholipase